MKTKIIDVINGLSDGSRVRIHVNPMANVQCALLFASLGKSMNAQWVDATLLKSSPYTSFFSVDGNCLRLPITRVQRRFITTDEFKTALFSYILDVEGAL